MTADSKHIIDDFDALPDPTKREVLAELIRIARYLDYPGVTDDELLASANEILLEYDRREESD
ncbi:MAG: hypothetical protein ACRD2A_04675 [Vicinamibacterales bacterium]